MIPDVKNNAISIIEKNGITINGLEIYLNGKAFGINITEELAEAIQFLCDNYGYYRNLPSI